jgi:hypothetical protein
MRTSNQILNYHAIWAITVAIGAAMTPVEVCAQLTSTDIVNDLAAAPNTVAGAVNVGSDAWWAQSFTTPNTSYSVDSVSVKLQNLTSPSGTYTVSLWDATGGSGVPGVSLATIASGNVSSLSTDLTDYTFIAPAGLTLAANTSYFVVVSASQPSTGSNPSNLGWSSTQDTTPTSTGPGQIGGWSTRNADVNGSWDLLISGNPFQIAVAGTAVPEPGLYAVLSGLGLIGFTLVRRRQQGRAG